MVTALTNAATGQDHKKGFEMVFSSISGVKATTHTRGVAQPAALVATFDPPVHFQLAMTTCLLSTPSTVVTGNSHNHNGVTKAMEKDRDMEQ